MRLAIAALILVTQLTPQARADVGVALFAQASRYRDQAHRSAGVALELSIDRPRWQYFTELAVGSTLLGDDELVLATDGALLRGALGARYLARRFAIDRAVAFELGFEALVGVQDLEWRGAARDVRPELAIGFNWNFELRKWDLTSRWSIRSFLAPSPGQPDAACVGSPCPTRDRIRSGYMVLMGVTW